MAAGKIKRLLATFFGRQGHSATGKAVKKSAPAAKRTAAAAKKAPAKKTAVKKAAAKKLSPRGPKKKGIYQARRKAWPKR